MKLTRLELSGFKSFADTVALTFDDGITAVVGPNGCGKSNVSDAVRWVLGEQRARILRGAKMEDIIFQGTTKRKPVNVASISLHFDNSDGVLPVSYREVVITRRLSRNGQSDYLMNQQPVRLKDVQDLLRGTGLASDGGVVIEAQQIDRLLSDRTDERRALFEEAAGIGLYRDRKTTTERRLDKTLEDLQRLDDVISEVQTQVRSLSRQRGKADRHQTLTADRFAIVMTLARRSLKKLDERVKETAQRKKEIDELLPEARKKIGELEQERENRVQKRASTEAQRAGLLRQLAERQEEAGKLEGDLTVATERLTNASSRVTRARDEMAHAERQKEQAKREKDAAQEELTQAAEARASVQTELDLRAAGEKETKDRLENQRTTCRTLENELQETAERHRSLSGEREALQRDVGDLTGQERELKERSETAEKNLEQATTKLADAERVLEDKRQANQQATSELEKARHTLAAAKENEAAVIAERRAVQERLLQTEARKEALEALERDRAGLAPAAKELLENQDQFDDGAVLGPLSDFLRPTAAGAESVEQVLSDWIHAVLVRDENAVEAVRKWHAEANPGPLVLLPIQPGPVTSGSLDDAFRLEVERPAKQWADALLAGHVSLGDGDAGGIRRPNGAVFLPGEQDKRGPLHRRAELDELRKAMEGLSEKASELDTRTNAAEDDLKAAGGAVEQAVQQEESTRTAHRDATGAHADADRERQRTEREHKEIQDSLERVQDRLSQRTVRLEEAEEELKSLTRTRTETEAELERQRTVLRRLDAEQDAAREHRVHWQVEEAQVTAREDAAREREARAQTALKAAEEEIEKLEAELSAIDTSTSESEQNKARWTDRLKELRAEIIELQAASVEAEKEMAESVEELERVQSQLVEQRELGENLNEESHHIDIEQTEAAGRRNALVERVEAEWRKPLAELLEAAPEVEGNDAELQEEAEQLAAALEAMGAVNPLAAQEHDEEKKRLEFLETQREDLVDARNSLLEALKEIDETARRLFQETFAAVRENFRKVFLTLFEVGECDVRLSDESDPLGCDIDIRAAPRGKRTQRIHLLSSGERALVATSLLFAIYLAKPSPFCLLDEVDAPLDDSNVQRFLRLLEEFKADTQFIVITHNPRTMQTADAVYGVTMQEPGVSSIVGVRLGEGAIA